MKKKKKNQKPKKSAQILTVSKNDWSEKWSSRCYLTINEWGWVSYEELRRSRRVFNMLISIDVKFTFYSARLGLFISANILQMADVALRVVFLLFLPFFLAIISPSSFSWNEWNVRHFLFAQPKQLNLVSTSSRLTVH